MISNFWTTGGGHVWPRERVERRSGGVAEPHHVFYTLTSGSLLSRP